jgi:ATP-dependent Clp protease adapter protein ClpS
MHAMFRLTVPTPRAETITEGDVLTVPEVGVPGSGGTDYRVVLYNDEWHGIDEVIEQVMKACEVGVEQAYQITMEAHYKGRAVCYRGSRERCHKVAKVLREIRLQCEVDCD